MSDDDQHNLDSSDEQNAQNTSREFVDAVSEHVREGKTGRAHQAFMRGWRDAVPELPLRFSVVLKRPDREVVARLHRLLLKHKQPELVLQRLEESLVEVRLQDLRDGDARVGNLPADDARLLDELGADSALYYPQILEIRYDTKGRLDHISIELLRPEVRYCSACGEKHDGPHVNCAKCRAKRRRKGEERSEPPSVHFHEALDALVGGEDAPVDEGDLDL